MKLKFDKKRETSAATDLLVLPITKSELKNQKFNQHLKRVIGERALEMMRQQKFTANHEQVATFSSARGKKSPTIIAIGLEHADADNTRTRLERLRSLGATIAGEARRMCCRHVAIHLDSLWIGDNEPLDAFCEGLILSQYRFTRFKTGKNRNKRTIESFTLVTDRTPPKNFVTRMEAICDSVQFARDLINTPPNEMRPSQLAAACKEVARKSKLAIEVHDSKKLTKLGAGGILCVGMGSTDQSYLVVLHYKPKGKTLKKVALVGKSVTFDTGGYSLKTSMETMKCDMAGGAAVLSAMQAIAQLKPNVEVTGYLPIVENMVNGEAVRPGDVYTLLCGKTVEVLNTDAEGRLILADALHLAQKEKPDMIIDLATLTGACAAALGSKYGGLFCNNSALRDLLIEASDLSGEPLWELPLAPEYQKLIYSDVADYKNLFKDARAITAALFLEEFVNKIPWAHLDIAGPAFTTSNEGAIRSGGVGFGVRTLIRLVERIAKMDQPID